MTDENDGSVVEKSSGQNGFGRRWGIRLAALLAAFLLGFVPMWLSSRTLGRDLAETKRELRRSQMQSSLASSVIDSRRGEYEIARQEASRFFTDVRTELDGSSTDVLTALEKTQVTGLLAGRDDIITLLSRNDPAASDRLSDLYAAFRGTMTASQ
ncbi:MAG TPA: hypothetical protein VK468_11880 [Pyrinomonadaceae bacterium]|jgi:hypothetical protein|nr:hypothetical protein [Pyrinomonadaceae bacterium]